MPAWAVDQFNRIQRMPPGIDRDYMKIEASIYRAVELIQYLMKQPDFRPASENEVEGLRNALQTLSVNVSRLADPKGGE